MKRVKKVGFREVEEIKIKGKLGEPEREVFARATLSPVMKAAVTINKFKTTNADFEMSDLIVVLDDQVTKTLEGAKLDEAQRMLAGQAHTLDAIFNSLAIHAVENIKNCHSDVELFMKLALRAQTQSRANLLALSEIRNPKLAHVVGQANISSGPQQINNHLGKVSAEEIENPPNELLEAGQHQRVDLGKKTESGEKNSRVETVDAIYRPKKRGRKKQIVS